MGAQRNNLAAVADESREIVATRVFDAPCDVVFSMWSDAEHLAHWWGPHGFTITTHEFDFRPGGAWRFIMHGPDGTDYKNHIVYDEIEQPSRIAYSHVSGPLFDAVATFEEQGEQTAVTVRMTFESAKLRNRVAEEFGAVEGLHQTLDRLAEQLAARTQHAVILTRMFDAPRAMVYEAWTDAKQLARWWGPYHFTNPICEVDARPGGVIRIGMQAPDGTIYPNRGEFREVVPPERLVFTLAALDDDGKVLIDALITARFDAHGEQTKLSITARVISFAPEAAAFLAGMEEGWSQQTERLETFLASPSTFVLSRTFDAPRDLVYRVWTEREHLLQWWGPKGFRVESCTNDPRPGGLMHYLLRGPGDSAMWGRWLYRELVPPERIVFVTSFSDEQGNITRAPFDEQWPQEMLNAITFEEHDGRTTVTLRSLAIHATDEERAVFHRGHASMNAGWGATFEILGDYLERATR